MSLADQLRESRSKHTLKSYAAAVKQLHVIKAPPPHDFEAVRLFLEYACERGLNLKGTFAALSRPPDDAGNEHEVWLQEENNTYLKIPWTDFFGMHLMDEEDRASPIADLERWHLHNELFGPSHHSPSNGSSGGGAQLYFNIMSVPPRETKS